MLFLMTLLLFFHSKISLLFFPSPQSLGIWNVPSGSRCSPAASTAGLSWAEFSRSLPTLRSEHGGFCPQDGWQMLSIAPLSSCLQCCLTELFIPRSFHLNFFSFWRLSQVQHFLSYILKQNLFQGCPEETFERQPLGPSNSTPVSLHSSGHPGL